MHIMYCLEEYSNYVNRHVQCTLLFFSEEMSKSIFLYNLVSRYGIVDLIFYTCSKRVAQARNAFCNLPLIRNIQKIIQTGQTLVVSGFKQQSYHQKLL